MRKKNLVVIAFLSWFIIACNNKAIVSQPSPASQFRVLGYLLSHNNWQADFNSIDLSQITDLNLAFINPDAAGHFPANDTWHQVIATAHSHNIKVFLSLGGGSAPAHLRDLLKADQRTLLVEGLVNTITTYGFDGVDVDIENDLINADYAPFVHQLSLALKMKNKLMTAALASWNSNLIADSTLRLYDFINIMSYDKTGPWNLSNPGPHSPFSMAQDDFTYYNVTRKIPAEKLLIGLPFYGYGFGNGVPQSLAYRDIVQNYPGAEHKDIVTTSTGGSIYYNGILTIQQKVSFAISRKANGVMIWQLLGDRKDDRSLLKAINAVKNK